MIKGNIALIAPHDEEVQRLTSSNGKPYIYAVETNICDDYDEWLEPITEKADQLPRDIIAQIGDPDDVVFMSAFAIPIVSYNCCNVWPINIWFVRFRNNGCTWYLADKPEILRLLLWLQFFNEEAKF